MKGYGDQATWGMSSDLNDPRVSDNSTVCIECNGDAECTEEGRDYADFECNDCGYKWTEEYAGW